MTNSLFGTRTVERALKPVAILAAVCFAAVALSTSAFAVSDRVKNSCRKDYNRFCSAYSIGTPELRQCMRSNGKKLTNRCFRALVDAGQVPRKYRKMRR